jgi:hypothetical protein
MYQSRNRLGAYTVSYSLFSRCKGLQALAEAHLRPGLILDKISDGSDLDGVQDLKETRIYGIKMSVLSSRARGE